MYQKHNEDTINHIVKSVLLSSLNVVTSTRVPK